MCVEIFEGMHQVLMAEIGDDEKEMEARKSDPKTTTTQTSMDGAVKPNKSKNYNTQYFRLGQVRRWPEGRILSVLPAKRRYWVLCWCIYQKLKSL